MGGETRPKRIRREELHLTKKQDSAKKQAPLWPLLVFALLLIFGGSAVFFYPTLANYMAERDQATVIENYIQTSTELDVEKMDAEWERARTYNNSLSGDPVQYPFLPGTGYVLPKNYMEVLNIAGDGVMGYLRIPKIYVNLPIFHGCDEEALQKGAGHIEQTHLPIGGESTHCVISGHRGLPHAEMFTRLDELEPGDEFYICVLGETLAYEVDRITVVLPEELENISVVEGEDLVTLVTCTPYAVNTHRLLVRGHRTEYHSEAAPVSVEPAIHVVYHGLDQNMTRIGAILGCVLLVIIVLILFTGKKRGRHRG